MKQSLKLSLGKQTAKRENNKQFATLAFIPPPLPKRAFLNHDIFFSIIEMFLTELFNK